MTNTPRPGFSRVRAGFTMIEMIIVLAIVAVLAALITPKVNSAISQARVQDSAAVIAGDLQLAFSLASRQRTPLRISVDPSGASYTIETRSGTVIRERLLGDDSDLHVGSLTSSVTTLDVFPNGLSSGPITITVGTNGYTQTVTMTRTGHVRVTS